MDPDEFCAVYTFAKDILGRTPTQPAVTYAAIQAPGGRAAAAELSVTSLIPAIAGPLLFGRTVGRMRRMQGR